MFGTALVVLKIAKTAELRLIVRNVLLATILKKIKHALAVRTPVKTAYVISSMDHAQMAVSMVIRESIVSPSVHLIAYNVICTILRLVFCVLSDFMVITVISVVWNARKAPKCKYAMKETELVNLVVKMVTGVRYVQIYVRMGAKILIAMRP